MTHKKEVEKYISDVLTGKIDACKYVKQACQRHVHDLANIKTTGMWFDEAAAKHVIEFFAFLRHSKGQWAGKQFDLEPWQKFILWVLFGWMRPDGTRRFRTAYIEVARKNGKSTWLAGVGLYLLGFDDEHGAEVYSAATKKDQAVIIHSEATRMVRSSKDLSKYIGIFKNSIFIEGTASKYVPLGADSKTEDGLNVHGALIDEYHAHPDAGMYDVLRSGMGARQQPIMLIITTAGFDRYCACYEERDYAIGTLAGSFDDDSYFAIIYTLDDETKWNDETHWIQANPNLGITVSIDDMRDMCRKAEKSPAKQNEFKTKKLNIWTEVYTRWILDEAWAACNVSVDPVALYGRRCYGAFDLSTTTDLTAWVLCFPPIGDETRYQFIYRFYMPADDLAVRFSNENIRALIKSWVKAGYILETPGNRVDYEFVKKQIKEDAEKYQICELPFDPYNATQLVNDLMADGFENKLVQFNQGIMHMSGPSKDFESKVLGAQLAHGGNPVMKWMISCTEVYRDANANIKPIKPDRLKSWKRIDGVVASIMALDRAVKGCSGISIYETGGVKAF